jgi:hypothetical protein
MVEPRGPVGGWNSGGRLRFLSNTGGSPKHRGGPRAADYWTAGTGKSRRKALDAGRESSQPHFESTTSRQLSECDASDAVGLAKGAGLVFSAAPGMRRAYGHEAARASMLCAVASGQPPLLMLQWLQAAIGKSGDCGERRQRG